MNESEQNEPGVKRVPIQSSGIGTRISAVADLYGDRKSAAAAGGISTDQLARYMRGDNQPPFIVMAKMAAQVGVSLEWIATGQGPMKKGEVAPAQPAAKISVDLLRSCIRVVNVYLSDKGLAPPEEVIAGLTAALYRYAEARGMADAEDMKEFLKLVA